MGGNWRKLGVISGAEGAGRALKVALLISGVRKSEISQLADATTSTKAMENRRRARRRRVAALSRWATSSGDSSR
jgi:hypothetical protein